MTRKEQEKQEAIERLREWLKPGNCVYTILRHVSRSGMQREISMRAIQDGGIIDLDYNAAKAMDDRIGKRGGIIVNGCGMDMGYSLVRNLAMMLWPKGFGCIGEGCPSEEHVNVNGDRDYTPHYEGARVIRWKLRGTGEEGKDIGTWGADDVYGKRELIRRNDLPPIYLFGDEVLSDEEAPRHWHSYGGYALRQRWL